MTECPVCETPFDPDEDEEDGGAVTLFHGKAVRCCSVPCRRELAREELARLRWQAFTGGILLQEGESCGGGRP